MTAYQNIIRPSKKDQKTASDSLLAYEAMVRSLKSSNPIVDIEEVIQQDMNQQAVQVSDANRLNAPYNANNYPGFDPQGQYIGIYTNLDKTHDSTEQSTVSDNPMDANWGGIQYTNQTVESGKYADRQVTKPMLYTPKTAFYPGVVDNERGPVDVI